VSSTTVPLVEVFSSVQGEGRHLGRATTFVRVAVCPIRCLYCDTPHSYRARPEFRLEVGGVVSAVANPVTPAAAAASAAASAAANRFGRTTLVSLTGGEPLLYPGFVAAFGPLVRADGRLVALETAAHDAAALRRCVAAIDHLSADYKLPGTMAAGDCEALGAACVACVAVAAAAGITIDVKMVLTAAVTDAVMTAALDRLAGFMGRFELILQPVTPSLAVDSPCPIDRVARLAALAADFEPRVVPQLHKQLGVE
jgi:organic radical activating enzyme